MVHYTTAASVLDTSSDGRAWQRCGMACLGLGWPGMGWAGLVWAGLIWSGLVWLGRGLTAKERSWQYIVPSFLARIRNISGFWIRVNLELKICLWKLTCTDSEAGVLFFMKNNVDFFLLCVLLHHYYQTKYLIIVLQFRLSYETYVVCKNKNISKMDRCAWSLYYKLLNSCFWVCILFTTTKSLYKKEVCNFELFIRLV